jgi:hypothetical protein
MALRYVKTQKTNGFFTDDHRAGVTVISTLNSDGNPKAQNPSVNLVSVKDASAGQVYLPLEYPIASLLALSSDQGKTFTKNILLELYMDKVRGSNTFGDVLDIAGDLLAKLPIPANPYVTAAGQVINYATSEITKASTDNGGQLFASVTLQFNDRDQSDVNQCEADGFETTGAIAVVAPKGQAGVTPLPLDKLNSDYCWSFMAKTTYEIQYAPKPASGCSGIPQSTFKDVPNDYGMVLLSAASVVPTNHLQDAFTGLLEKNLAADNPLVRRERDLKKSRKLCDSLELPYAYCGAQ